MDYEYPVEKQNLYAEELLVFIDDLHEWVKGIEEAYYEKNDELIEHCIIETLHKFTQVP